MLLDDMSFSFFTDNDYIISFYFCTSEIASKDIPSPPVREQHIDSESHGSKQNSANHVPSESQSQQGAPVDPSAPSDPELNAQSAENTQDLEDDSAKKFFVTEEKEEHEIEIPIQSENMNVDPQNGKFQKDGDNESVMSSVKSHVSHVTEREGSIIGSRPQSGASTR